MAVCGGLCSKLWVLCVLCLGLCASGVEAAKIMLTKQTRLATLFAGPSFSGNYFSVEGIYETCYNLRDSKVESIMLERGTSYCEVYVVGECGQEDDGKDIPREVFEPTPTLNWDSSGEARDKVKRNAIEITEVKSLRCFRKNVVEKSTE